MMQEVCQPQSTRMDTSKTFKFCFGPSQSVQIILNFKPTQLARALRIFGHRPTCLQPVLAGGSTVHSGSQLQPNKSRARVPVNHGRAVSRPSLAELLRAAGAPVSRRTRGLSLSRAAVLRHIVMAASKPCFAANLGFREIQVDVRTSDVMAGAGGAAGPAQDVRHQPEGTARRECRAQCIYTLYTPLMSPTCSRS
jgi:hypothetical protein